LARDDIFAFIPGTKKDFLNHGPIEEEATMKRFSLILVFVFLLAVVAYVVLGEGLVRAEKAVNKTDVPQQYRHAGKIDCAS
jgi:preprotein translocase subunit SecG